MLFQPYLMFPTNQNCWRQNDNLTTRLWKLVELLNLRILQETGKSDVEDGVAHLHEAQATEEQKRILQLENEVSSLKAQLKEKESMMEVILNKEQIYALKRTPNQESKTPIAKTPLQMV
ncbi:uncharacterized protein LOC120354417 [Nilaparvata lugens]|uniref:uncharacterized protein LOC120354417 n=1 Tax=Nilaparvata lugens TaxID=108931 RepID=UPI00193D7E08|nr:uncharacterized protein LOC120354417 [Nilaparvata lugens]